MSGIIPAGRIVGRHRCGNWVERLEDRCLFSTFEAHINFQLPRDATPPGYVADVGATFADRGNGYSYGWNGPKRAIVREQHSRRTPGLDLRYDTFAILNRRGRGSVWQLAVPNGAYTVHVIVGSPTAASARYRIEAEGAVIVDGKATRNQRWVDGVGLVNVSDGLLTITLGPHVGPGRLDFVDVVQQLGQGTPPGGSTPTPTSTPTPQPAPRSAPTPTPTPTPTPAPTPTPTPTPPPTAGPFPNTLTWKTAASAPTALLEAQSAVANNKLYVFGGYNVDHPNFLATTKAEVFDPSTNTWTAIAPMPEPLSHIGVATDGKSIYLAGGYVTDFRTSYQTFGTRDVWRYDIASNTWSPFVPLPAPRAAGALVLLGNELHYVDGVNPARITQTTHYVLNLADADPQWTVSTPLPVGRNHMTAVVLNDKIYAIGGQPGTSDADPSNSVFVWDPANPDVWTAVASLPQARSHAVTTVVDGRIVLAGGETSGAIALSSVIDYDPATNAWSSLTSVPAPRLAPAGGFVDGRLIVTTGDEGGLKADTWYALIG